MCSLNIVLRLVEHEKGLITLGPGRINIEDRFTHDEADQMINYAFLFVFCCLFLQMQKQAKINCVTITLLHRCTISLLSISEI